MAVDNKLASDYIGEDITDLLGSILRSETEFKEVLIKINKAVSTAQFNAIKEFVLRFTKSYKVNNRKYKDNDTIIIYYKFILSDLSKVKITTIHKNNTLVMFLRDIKIIRY